MIPAPALYPNELVSSGLTRCCRWFNLPFKRFAGQVLGRRDWRLNFLNSWPLRPLEPLFRQSAEDLLWNHTAFPYATAFLEANSFEDARRAALDGGRGMPRLLAAMQNVSSEISWRRFCPQCLQDSLARYGESYWDRSHNLPGVLFCPKHRCALVHSTLPARSTLKTIYELPVECAGQSLSPELGTTQAALALAKASQALLVRAAGPGASRDSEWYRSLAIAQGWLSATREVSRPALERGLRKAYSGPVLTAAGLDPGELGWAALCFRPASSFNLSPLKHLLVEAFLKTSKASSAVLDHFPPGPRGTASIAVDAFYAPKARLELKRALKRGEVLTTDAFLDRIGARGPYRHRAEQLPSLRQVVLAFRRSAASVKRLRPSKTLYRKRVSATNQDGAQP